MTSIIHVNRQNIAMNRKDGKHRPVYTIKKKGQSKAIYAQEVFIEGPSRMVYRPDDPHKCGAVAWIETDCSLRLSGETDFKGSRDI